MATPPPDAETDLFIPRQAHNNARQMDASRTVTGTGRQLEPAQGGPHQALIFVPQRKELVHFTHAYVRVAKDIGEEGSSPQPCRDKPAGVSISSPDSTKRATSLCRVAGLPSVDTYSR